MPNEEPQDQLVLDSRLDEVSRAQSWAEALVEQIGLSEKTRYAIRLCLEEALANVILHGYKSESGHCIVIRRRLATDMLFFEIEDKAPPFYPDNVLAATGAPFHRSLKTITPGGNGIQLLRHFAGSLVYEQFPRGNRLTVGFSRQPS